MINELGRSPTRLENVYFANNERASVADLYCCVLFYTCQTQQKKTINVSTIAVIYYFS